MRSMTTFCAPRLTKVLTGYLITGSLLLSACSARPDAVSSEGANQDFEEHSAGFSTIRPGDFRLGIVVQRSKNTSEPQESDPVLGGDARYIVDPSSWLRSSFGAGSSLTTYPGFTRRLDADEMSSIWDMCTPLIESAIQNPEFGMFENGQRLQPGQTQLLDEEAGLLIIEIHASGRDYVLAMDPAHPQSRELVDTVAALSWVNRVPNLVNPNASKSINNTTADTGP
ncbi:MAG: hypothetical protein AB8C13_04650 [Phycisphaerales bacterium]